MNKYYLIILLLLLCGVPAYPQTGLEVVSTFIPPRPVTAIAVGAYGEVDVLVVIDADGNVISADAFKGHPLLKQVAKAAALKWKFGKDAGSTETRTANLTFNFLNTERIKVIEKSEKKSESVSSEIFLTPFWAEIDTERLIPKLLLLPREKGKVKSETCLLHQEEMGVDIVKTSIDHDPGNDLEGYEEAEENEFPNAHTWYRDWAEEEMKEAEIHFCKTCRLKREEWIREHSGSN